MKIAQSVLDEWKLLADRGDQKKISDQEGLSKYKVCLAITHGSASEEVFKVIKKFFDKKKLNQKKISDDAEPY